MSVYHRDNAHFARRLLAGVLIVVGVGLMVGLYYVKVQAQTAQADVRRLTLAIEQERAAISVLRAELAHLESPARVQGLAGQHLGLVPMEQTQIASLDDIEHVLPPAPEEGLQ